MRILILAATAGGWPSDYFPQRARCRDLRQPVRRQYDHESAQPCPDREHEAPGQAWHDVTGKQIAYHGDCSTATTYEVIREFEPDVDHCTEQRHAPYSMIDHQAYRLHPAQQRDRHAQRDVRRRGDRPRHPSSSWRRWGAKPPNSHRGRLARSRLPGHSFLPTGCGPGRSTTCRRCSGSHNLEFAASGVCGHHDLNQGIVYGRGRGAETEARRPARHPARLRRRLRHRAQPVRHQAVLGLPLRPAAVAEPGDTPRRVLLRLACREP